MTLEGVFRYIMADNFIELFSKKNEKSVKIYENAVFELMNISDTVFPSSYRLVTDQSNGQCDFIDCISGEKYDAKLPFESNHMKMLTSGKNHKPEIEKWFREMAKEAEEFDSLQFENDSELISRTKLYTIMKEQILRDKKDENIIFFLPYPIVFGAQNSFISQCTFDFLDTIYEKLKDEIDLGERKIYAIYPSCEINKFVLRDMCENEDNNEEFIVYDKLAKYFTYEVIYIRDSEFYSSTEF